MIRIIAMRHVARLELIGLCGQEERFFVRKQDSLSECLENVQLGQMIIGLFCSRGGLVMDPFGETLMAETAATSTHREYIVTKKDELCFRASVHRLFRCIASI